MIVVIFLFEFYYGIQIWVRYVDLYRQFFNSLQSIFAEVVVSPPFVFIPYVKSELRSEFHVAAQNCWVKKGGAFTGEIRYVFVHLISVLGKKIHSSLSFLNWF